MRKRMLIALFCAAALLCTGCAHNLKDLPGATTQPTEMATPQPTEGAALDADTIAMMEQTATAYAKQALFDRMAGESYMLDAVDTSARATFDGVFLVTLRYHVQTGSQYAYILRVDGDLQCEVLAEGVELTIEDMGRL